MLTEDIDPAHPDTAVRRPAGWLIPACISVAVAALLWGLAYLYFATPGPFFGGNSTQNFTGERLTASRGVGRVSGKNFVILATDASDLAIVSLNIPALRAAEFRRVRWFLSDVQDDIALALLWRTNQAPGKVNSVPLTLYKKRAQALLTPGEQNWDGDIEGLALAVRGKLRGPLTIGGVSVDPMSAAATIDDLADDWFTFTPWNGLSINTAFGGQQEQALWLPIVVVVVALTALGLCALWRRRPAVATPSFSLLVVGIIVAAWIALDARWLWLRLQQTHATGALFSGKSQREKHISDIDGYVFAFAEQVRARVPNGTARIYVAADDHYFGARMAYHLYPNNVYVDHVTGALPPSAQCKPGEYVVIFRRQGVRYDTALQLLSWDDQPPLHAQVVLAHLGNAMFKLL